MLLSPHDKPNESPRRPSEKEISDAAATLARTLQPESAAAKSSLHRLARIWLQTPESRPGRVVILDFILQEWGLQQCDTPVALHQLGRSCYQAGFVSDAEHVLQEAAESAGLVLGMEHPRTLDVLSDWALALAGLGRVGEAEQIDRLVWERRRRVLGADHFETLTSMSNLGADFLEQGKTKEAEALFHQTADLARDALGLEHLTTLRALFNLGVLWHKQGRLPEAETQIRLVLQILGRVPDPGQTGLLDPAQNLMISILESQGKTEEAAARRESLWPTPVLGVLDSCPGGEQKHSAAAAAARQKAQQALTNAQRLLWLLRPVNTPPEVREGVGLRNYHESLLDPAESCAGRAAADCAGHPEYGAEAHAALGQAFKLLGQPARAETEFHLGLASCRKIKGNNHEGVRWLLRELALVLLDQAKLAEAEKVMRDELQVATCLGGKADPQRLMVLRNLGLVLYQQKRFAEAETVRREEVEVRRPLPGEFHEGMTMIGRELLADAILAQNRTREAHTLYRQVLKWFEKSYPDHPATIRLQMKTDATAPPSFCSSREVGNGMEAEE